MTDSQKRGALLATSVVCLVYFFSPDPLPIVVDDLIAVAISAITGIRAIRIGKTAT